MFVYILYTISYGLSLLNKGIYWDDWTSVYNLSPETLISLFSQYGSPWVSYLHIFLQRAPDSIFVYRLLIFILNLLPVIFLEKILSEIKEIDKLSRIFILLFFVLLPANDLRIALILLPYSISNALFFFGLWSLNRYLKRNIHIFRLVSLIAFFVSFATGSYLVFYLIVILYLFYMEKQKRKKILTYFSILKKYADFIILPFIFWFIKSKFFRPYGLYEGYNGITIQSLTNASIESIRFFYTYFYNLFSLLLNSVNLWILFFSSLVVFIILMRQNSVHIIKSRLSLLLFILGLFILYIAIFPYFAANHTPSFDFWDSRHLLLTPLGVSLIMYYGIGYMLDIHKINQKIKYYIYSIIVVLFVFYNLKNNYFLIKDWYKQDSLVEGIKTNDIIKNNFTFVINDKTKEYNLKNRHYAFYEYTGIMRKAFGDQKRLGINSQEYEYIKSVRKYNEFFNVFSNLKDYSPEEPKYLITINKGSYSLDPKNVIFLTYSQFFDKNYYNNSINNILVLNVNEYK